jgi:hypothetical protein
MGLAGIMANVFLLHTELSLLTMVRAALGDAGALRSTAAATAAIYLDAFQVGARAPVASTQSASKNQR